MEKNHQKTIGLDQGEIEVESIRINTVREVVAKKVWNLIFPPREDWKTSQPMGKFGISSMLAAEFRIFTFQSTNVDVRFMELLEKSASADSLARLIPDQMELQNKE